MKCIWNRIDRKNWTVDKKYIVFTLLLSILSALIGLAVWLVVKPWAFSSMDWLFCFIGYPVFFSWIAEFLYAGRHDFHEITIS